MAASFANDVATTHCSTRVQAVEVDVRPSPFDESSSIAMASYILALSRGKCVGSRSNGEAVDR